MNMKKDISWEMYNALCTIFNNFMDESKEKTIIGGEKFDSYPPHIKEFLIKEDDERKKLRHDMAKLFSELKSRSRNYGEVE